MLLKGTPNLCHNGTLSGLVLDTVRLRDELRKRQNEVTNYILMAAKLLAPAIDKQSGNLTGYDWVVEQMNAQVGLP